MPYSIRGNCVYKQGQAKPLKCYGNKRDALAYLRALEANVSDAKSFQGLIQQSECNYVPLSPVAGKACANCRWFLAQEQECFICSGYPEPILATGYCDRWEATPAPESPSVEPIPVTIVEPPMSDEDSGEMEMALPTNRKSLREMIVETVKSMLNPSEPAFSVFKAQDGKRYWIARHTGKYVDREKEIIADKAHDEYVDRVQKGLVPMPELWIWHTKGTRHGVADMVWKSGGFTLALGHFDDTPEGLKAYEYYQKQRGKIKLSHMFNYPKRAKQNGVYYAYNTVEITTLPDGAEAFPYTSFEEIKSMSLSDTQRDFIRNIGGDEMLKRVETADNKALADTSKLDAAGVASKGLEDFTGSTIPQDESVKALETKVKALEGLPVALEGLTLAMKDMSAQLVESRKAENAALEKVNLLEKKLAEYMAVSAPGTQSKDTLLSDRDAAALKAMEDKSKLMTQKSLVDMMVGN